MISIAQGCGNVICEKNCPRVAATRVREGSAPQDLTDWSHGRTIVGVLPKVACDLCDLCDRATKPCSPRGALRSRTRAAASQEMITPQQRLALSITNRFRALRHR